MQLNKISWRLWPVVATALALTFIIWDISLVSRSHRAQERISEQVLLLDHLAAIRAGMDDLSGLQRAEPDSLHRNWPGHLLRNRNMVQELEQFGIKAAGIPTLRRSLNNALQAADSLHALASQPSMVEGAERRERAIAQIVLQRIKTDVDTQVRRIHDQGLRADMASAANVWGETQFLLGIACLIAVVLALLVGTNRKLLFRSEEDRSALEQAHSELETMHRELRETMLSKEEKEVMIKEIHHRVKNNLQIVRSLIRFQSDKVTDPVTLELFHECINRVGAMALVHEQTYLSKDLANIDVNSYMSSLVRDLISAYNVRLQLETDIDIQVRTLGVDTLVPLGLLINEIVSNSFKHAFKERDKGRIIVHLRGQEGDLELYIGDDGVGLPDTGKWERPESLGMELVHTLAGQLDATIEMVPGQGTRYILKSIATKDKGAKRA